MNTNNERPLTWEENIELDVHREREPFYPRSAEFLRQVHPDGDGFLELRAFRDRVRPELHFVPLPLTDDRLLEVQTFLQQHRNDRNVYHGIATRATNTSGTLDNCLRLNALYVEIDLKRGTPLSEIWHKLTLDHQFQSNEEAIANGLLLPSAIIHSGGGLHVYWLLAESLDLTTPVGRNRAYQWLGDLAHKFGGEPESTEPARILRVPDTINHKPQYARPFVTVLSNNWNWRYTIDQVVAALGDYDATAPAVQLSPAKPLDHGLDVAARTRLARMWLAMRDPAVQGQGGDQHTVHVCASVAIGHDLDESEAFPLLKEWNARCTPPWSDSTLRQKLRNAIRYCKGQRGEKLFALKDGKIVKDSQRNVRIAFDALELELKLNEFTDKIEVTRRQKTTVLDDAVRDDIWLKIDEQLKFRPSQDFFDKMLRKVARENTYHPVRDYLTNLRWDKAPRIDTWLVDHAGADDTPYIRAVSRLFLVAAVTRIMRPGCKFDEMLVLQSGQGMEKSTALRKLCPNPEWFSDDLPLNIDSKQVIERTAGKWIIEASDLHGYSKRDVDQLKAMLSRQVDGPARMAYARLPVERPRHFVIAGTTNPKYFLGKDKTGHRRFWPVEVGRFDIGSLFANRDQLWAEAMAAYEANESIRLARALWAAAGKQQAAHEVEDDWLVTLREALGHNDHPANPKDRFSLDEPWNILRIEAKDRDETKGARMSGIMQALGYVKRRSKGPVGSGLPLDKKTSWRWVLTDERKELLRELDEESDDEDAGK